MNAIFNAVALVNLAYACARPSQSSRKEKLEEATAPVCQDHLLASADLCRHPSPPGATGFGTALSCARVGEGLHARTSPHAQTRTARLFCHGGAVCSSTSGVIAVSRPCSLRLRWATMDASSLPVPSHPLLPPLSTPLFSQPQTTRKWHCFHQR